MNEVTGMSVARTGSTASPICPAVASRGDVQGRESRLSFRLVVVELKSVSEIEPVHEAQILTYMKPRPLEARFVDQLQRQGTDAWDPKVHSL